jgi:hypothetical protein
MKLAEWFAKERYQGIYQIGDRVEGRFNSIPFVGSVGTDSIRYDGEEPHVTVTLDLPLLFESIAHRVLRVPTSSVKLRK